MNKLPMKDGEPDWNTIYQDLPIFVSDLKLVYKEGRRSMQEECREIVHDSDEADRIDGITP